jgi:Tol biopolymer transport system component
MAAMLAFSSHKLDGTYQERNGAVFLAESDGSNLSCLVSGRGRTNFAWAPNGQQLAFIAKPDPLDAITAALYVVDADSSHQRRLTASPHLHTLYWSPDSQHLAFTSEEEMVDSTTLAHLSVIDTDGSHLRRLASDLYLYLVAWSPDSQQLALLSSPHLVTKAVSSLSLLAIDGSNPRRLIEEQTNLRSPCWLPDNRHLSVAWYRDGGVGVYLIDTATWRLDLLGNGVEPTWSPDRSHVAFVGEDKGGAHAVHVVDIDSRNARCFPFEDRSYPSCLAWSSDGQRLALAVNRQLSMIDRHSSQSSALAEMWWDTDFSWSPDGKEIAFISDPGPDSDVALEIIDVESRQRRVLARDVTFDEMVPDTPLWSPDGSQIAFTAFLDDGTQDVYVIDADGSNRRCLSNSTAEDFIDYIAWQPEPRTITGASARAMSICAPGEYIKRGMDEPCGQRVFQYVKRWASPPDGRSPSTAGCARAVNQKPSRLWN